MRKPIRRCHLKLFDIGTKIRELRKERGITQEQLAKAVAISRVTIGKLERGQVGAVSITVLDLILNEFAQEIEFKPKDEFGFGIPIFSDK
jgi:transcriptional regulator with XRE-family HTH domain